MKLSCLLRHIAVVSAAVLLAVACEKDSKHEKDLPSIPVFETVEGSASVYTISGIVSDLAADYDVDLATVTSAIQLLPILGINGLDGLATIVADETPYGTENIIYRSKDPFGKDLRVSGRLYYGVGEDGEMIAPTHILLSNHHTLGSNEECPTENISFEAAYACNGALVLCPDAIGYGQTKELPHPYCIPDITASVNVDMLRAAKAYLESKGFDGLFETLDIYNIGYSQGGYSALATQKYMETNASVSKEFSLKKTCCGGGPYCVDKTLESYAANNSCAIPGAIVMMVEGCRWVLSDLASGDDTQWYSQAILDKDIKNMVLSKNYTLDKINTAVHNATSGSFTGIFADWEKEKPLLELAARKCSVVCGDGWKPKTQVSFYHAPNDDYVPYLNQTEARSALGNANTTFEDGMAVPELLKALVGDSIGEHVFNGVLFYAHMICGDYKK